MKTVAIIPMKLNNERLPNKNTKMLKNGKPLCSYILSTITKVKNIDEVYVYCSDERIIKFLPKNVHFLKRDKKLDKSTTTMNEILKEFTIKIAADIYVLTHVTAPFIKVSTFEKCIEMVRSNKYDSAFSVKKIQEFLWKDGQPLNYNLEDIPRTQDLPGIFSETCGLYIFKSEVINKYNRRIGNNPYMCEVDDMEAIDIDNQFDFDIANCLVDRYEANDL